MLFVNLYSPTVNKVLSYLILSYLMKTMINKKHYFSLFVLVIDPFQIFKSTFLYYMFLVLVHSCIHQWHMCVPYKLSLGSQPDYNQPVVI